MASTIVVLVGGKIAEDVDTTQYTVDLNETVVIDKFTATNFSGTAASLSVNLVQVATPLSDDNLVVQTREIIPGQTYNFPELIGHAVEAQGFISTIASAANSLNIRITGRIIS